MSLANFPDRLDILPASTVESDGALFGLARSSDGNRLAVLAPAGHAALSPLHGATHEHYGDTLLIGPADAANARALRPLLPWLTPRPLGLRTSAGMGDRLGLATPGHVRALRAAGGQIAPLFAQQSIREMVRTGRTPQQVVDDATWGAFAEGWTGIQGADADHLKTTADIDACAAAGFTFFTIDPGDVVDDRAGDYTPADLSRAVDALPWAELEDSRGALLARYAGAPRRVESLAIAMDAETVLRAAVKYGRAMARVLAMYRHVLKVVPDAELEVSVDETALPTSPAEHMYIAEELRRLGVSWVSLAPRFVGRFEKGVDYIGDLAALDADLAAHAAIARAMGPYKISLHSGSDKFSVYPLAMKHTRGMVHLKTAGTSYLEALRTIAAVDPALFREIYVFARVRYPTDRASYHVSAEVSRAPDPAVLSDHVLPSLLDDFHAREVMHVTFGSVLTTRRADGGWLFYDRLMQTLRDHSEAYAVNLQGHFLRHLRPFAVPTP